MKRALIIAGLSLALASCGNQQRGADGFVFGDPEFTSTALSLQVVLHENVQSLRRAQPAGYVEPGRQAMAWSRVWPAGRCEVHIVAPTEDYSPEWMGHEIAHCIHGRWHD